MLLEGRQAIEPEVRGEKILTDIALCVLTKAAPFAKLRLCAQTQHYFTRPLIARGRRLDCSISDCNRRSKSLRFSAVIAARSIAARASFKLRFSSSRLSTSALAPDAATVAT